MSAGRERHAGRQTIGIAAQYAREVSRISRQTGICARRLDWSRRCKAEQTQKNSTRTKRQSNEDAQTKDAGLRRGTFLHNGLYLCSTALVLGAELPFLWQLSYGNDLGLSLSEGHLSGRSRCVFTNWPRQRSALIAKENDKTKLFLKHYKNIILSGFSHRVPPGFVGSSAPRRIRARRSRFYSR